MAGPGGREVGRVSVRVLPDTSSFGQSLERYLDRMERRLRLEIPVSLSAPDVARTEAELAALTRDRKIELKLDVDKDILGGLGKSLGGGGVGGIGSGLSSALKPNLIMLAAIVAALPVIATGILALPSMLFGLLAPIGAIALGFEGIKRAASGLAAPFAALRASVADTFEKGLTPSFEKLADIFPTLTTGVNELATALSTAFAPVVDSLTSDEGLALIGEIFSNLASAITVLAPALGPLTTALLTLLVEGTAAFERFAPYLADFLTGFARLIDLAERSGVLAAAFDGLSAVLLILAVSFGQFLVVGMSIVALFDGLIRAAGAFFGTVTRLAGSITGTVLGLLSGFGSMIATIFTGAMLLASRAVSTGIPRIVAFFRALPGKITSALGKLAGQLQKIGGQAMQGLWQGIKDGAGRVLQLAASIASKIASTIAGALKVRSPSRVMMRIGEHVTEGLRRGIASGQPDVEATMLRLAGAVSGADLRATSGSRFLTGSTASGTKGLSREDLVAALAALKVDVTLGVDKRTSAKIVNQGVAAGARML